MNIHYFQHVPFEGLGSIESWAKRPIHKMTATRLYEDHKLPFIDICELLIVMGGPMGANDDAKYPFLTEEKKFIERAITKGKKVIGICLGAQLIADVLGAKVYKNKEKEIGWMPIQLTEEGKKTPLFSGFSESQTVFHWHGDTFDLPKGSVHIAKSEACENQAFLYNNQVLGLQFHLESTRESVLNMLENCRDEITKAAFIQSEEEIKNTDHIYKNNYLMEGLLNRL